MTAAVERGELLLKGAKDVMAMSPSQFVEAALQDLELVVAGEVPITSVDFNQWVCVDEDTGGKTFCTVCYAGATMVKRFGLREDPFLKDNGIIELAPSGLGHRIRSAASSRNISLGAYVGNRFSSDAEVTTCISEWLEALNQLRLGSLRQAVNLLIPLKERAYAAPSLPYTDMTEEARNRNNDLLPDAGVWCSVDAYQSYGDKGDLCHHIGHECCDEERRRWELGCIPHFASYVREVFIPELQKVGW